MPPTMSKYFRRDIHKIEKKKTFRQKNTVLRYKRSFKCRSVSHYRKKTNRSRKKSKKVQKMGKAKADLNVTETSDEGYLPTILQDYSSQAEGVEKNVITPKKIRRPWNSPGRETSDSGPSGSSSEENVLKPSPIHLRTDDPTPPGLFAYTPYGFNGYIRYTFKCVYCSKLYETAESLFKHCNAHHYGDKPHECPFCRERFSFRLRYAEHLKEHISPWAFPTYKCQVCTKRFSSAWELKLHFATHTNSNI